MAKKYDKIEQFTTIEGFGTLSGKGKEEIPKQGMDLIYTWSNPALFNKKGKRILYETYQPKIFEEFEKIVEKYKLYKVCETIKLDFRNATKYK